MSRVGHPIWRSRIETVTFQLRVEVVWNKTRQRFSVRLPVCGLRLRNSNKSENDDVCVITFSGMLCAKHLHRNSKFFGRKLQSLSQEATSKCKFQTTMVH
jgi:hypothetical protein